MLHGQHEKSNDVYRMSGPLCAGVTVQLDDALHSNQHFPTQNLAGLSLRKSRETQRGSSGYIGVNI